MTTIPVGRFAIHTAHEATLPLPDIKWLVEDLLEAGSVCLLVGESGSKKTWAVLDLAVCLAMGKPWLGMATCKSPVLFIDEESGELRLLRRLNKVMTGHKADPNLPFLFTTMERLNLRVKKGEAELLELIKNTGVALVIIDALQDVMPGADENAVKDVAPVFLNIVSVARKTGVSFLLIHHTGKNGGYRGSTSMLGEVDTMIAVDSKPSSNAIEFTFVKCRDGKFPKFAAMANFEQDSFHLSTTFSTPQTKKRGRPQQFVLDYLTANGPSTISDMEDNADTCSPKSVRAAVFELVNDGAIDRVNKGTKGAPGVFDIKAYDPWQAANDVS